MSRARILLAVCAAIFIQTYALSAHAQAAAGKATASERQKTLLISRLYQLTYGNQERCQFSEDASTRFAKTLADFKTRFPELMATLENSPQLPAVKEQFKRYLSERTPTATGQVLVQECSGFEFALRQLIDEPSGEQVADQYVQLLKQ